MKLRKWRSHHFVTILVKSIRYKTTTTHLKSPQERAKQVRKPGTTPVRRRGPGRPGVVRPTIRDQIAEALLLRDKDRKGKTKHLPTGKLIVGHV